VCTFFACVFYQAPGAIVLLSVLASSASGP
jgi:hypothetical protein